MDLFASAASRRQLLWLSLAALYAAAALWAFGGVKVADEWVHFDHVYRFSHGDFSNYDQYLTSTAAYHAVVAAALWLAGADSLGAARVVTALIGIIAIFAFRGVYRRAHGRDDDLAVAQFVVLPILFPYFFLVYTDTLSLALVLAATAAALSNRHVLASAAITLAMATRQNNVVWAGFLATFAAWPMLQEQGLRSWKSSLRAALPFTFPVAIFLAYWSWHGTISFSTDMTQVHPDVSLHVGNVYFAVFLAALFCPLHVVLGLGEFWRRLAHRPWLALIPIAALALFFLCFNVDNPLNATVAHDNYFNLRNYFLFELLGDPYAKAIFGTFTVVAGCALLQAPLEPRAAFWMYPFAALVMAASWLIEPRYTLIALVLWHAFRPRRSALVEKVTLAYWALLAIYFFLGTIEQRFFI